VVPVARSALFPATLTSVLVSASTQTAGEDQFTAALHEHQQGQLRVAARPYEALLARAPDRFDALSNLGLVYGELGNYDGAIGLLMKALRLAPSQSNIRLNLAMTYFQAKRYRDAAGKAGQVVSAQPTSALAHYIFGLALLKTDQLEVGIGQLERVITAQSGNPSAAATLASAYMKSHQIDKARTLVTGVLSRSDTPDAHLVIGTYNLRPEIHARGDQVAARSAAQPGAHATRVYTRRSQCSGRQPRRRGKLLPLARTLQSTRCQSERLFSVGFISKIKSRIERRSSWIKRMRFARRIPRLTSNVRVLREHRVTTNNP
jgi:tetratricopeptide (TPR) repeat protein